MPTRDEVIEAMANNLADETIAAVVKSIPGLSGVLAGTDEG